MDTCKLDMEQNQTSLPVCICGVDLCCSVCYSLRADLHGTGESTCLVRSAVIRTDILQASFLILIGMYAIGIPRPFKTELDSIIPITAKRSNSGRNRARSINNSLRCVNLGVSLALRINPSVSEKGQMELFRNLSCESDSQNS